jgi:hypothetical protein
MLLWRAIMVVQLSSSQVQRYQRLVEAEQELLRLRLQQATAAAAARAEHLTDDQVDALIERARAEVNQP